MRAEDFNRAIGDAGSAPPHRRFGVYRNNVTAALVTALRVRFPMLHRLLGESAFFSITSEYISNHKPGSPVLIDYGANFPDHLAAINAESRIIDLARLENGWWQAYHAEESEPLDAQAFAALDPDSLDQIGFRFHPSVQVLHLSTEAASLWQALQVGVEKAHELAKAVAPQFVLVARPDADVSLLVIDEPSAGFLSLLIGGATLGEAFAAHPGIDITRQLQRLIGTRICTAFHEGSAS